MIYNEKTAMDFLSSWLFEFQDITEDYEFS